MEPHTRHGRTCSGHLWLELKTWMPATSAGMTVPSNLILPLVVFAIRQAARTIALCLGIAALPHGGAWPPQPQRIVTPTRTSSFAPPILRTAYAGCLFESGETKALSLMIYDNPARPGNIAPEVANERGIVIQFAFGPY